MFNYASMNEIIQEGIRDTNKERNLRSTDPIFCDNFKKEWDEITAKLRKANEIQKTSTGKSEAHSYVRYSASAIEFK